MQSWQQAFVSLTITAAGLVACGADEQATSKQEREDRQDLTFDVAGCYFEDAASASPARLTITNERDYHDIVATLELRGGLDDADLTALKAVLRRDDPSLTDVDLAKVVGTLETKLLTVLLGEGATYPQRGGESVSLDMTGDTAEIALRGSLSAMARSSTSIYDATLDLFMTARRGAGRLDFQSTPHTDPASRGASGVKGLLLSLTRTSDAGASTTVTTELPLTLALFLKL